LYPEKEKKMEKGKGSLLQIIRRRQFHSPLQTGTGKQEAEEGLRNWIRRKASDRNNISKNTKKRMRGKREVLLRREVYAWG